VTSVLSDQLRDYGVDDQRLWVDAAGRLMRPGSCDNAWAIVVCKQGVTGSSPVGSTTKNRPTTRPFSAQARTALAVSHAIVAELTPI
jgi:hypothetical protein